MRKSTVLLVFLLFLGIQAVFAQRTISGVITSSQDGSAVPGVTVLVKEATKVGTLSDANGKYTLKLPANAKTLRFTFIGMKTTEVAITASNVVNVTLESEVTQLESFVVTAIGIKRSQKALGYSASSVTSSDLTETGNRSALTALQGKVAGVEISSASGAPGSSTRVIMRGFSSLGGSNQPLYIVDGVPVNNQQIGSTSINGGLDFGNRGNDINPDDIESMTILKGGSATALYGSRAASGVILITTKNGAKSNNTAKIDFSSTTTFDTPLRLPVMQNEFGQGWYDRNGGAADLMENGSWGPKFDNKIRKWGFVVDNQQMIKPYSALPNNVKDFFEVGRNFNNTIAISNGDDNKSYYMSFGNINSDGIMPGNADSYKRNNFSLRGSSKFMKIFTASGSLNYVKKDSKYAATGQEQSALDGVWQTARDISLIDQRDYHNKFNNVDNYYTVYAQNPYYILGEHGNKFVDNRIFGNVGLEAKLLPWLTANFKAGSDVSNSTLKQWRAITRSVRADYNKEDGHISEDSYYSSELNTDFFLSINPTISKNFTISAILGHNFNQRDARSQGESKIGLDIPFFYNLANSSTSPVDYDLLSQRRLVGVYGSVDFGYKSMLFLNVSARNDWSSTLPASNRSFFYPSISGSFLFTELIGKNDILSYGKVRASIAQTGKDADPYQIYPYFVQTAITDGYRYLNFPVAGNVNSFSVSNLIGNDKLKPEISTDFEIGTDLKFLNNRIGLDLAVYNKTVTDLIWASALPTSTGFTTQTQNLGKLTNKGVEINFTVTPIRTKDFEWEIFANFSKNVNKLVSLKSGLDQVNISGTSSIGYVARPGYPLGLFEGLVPATDPNGNPVVNATGLPVFKDTKEILGNSQNDYRIGGGTSLSYKGIRLHATVDYRKGGLMYSRTAEMMYFTGNAPQTTYNDRQPWIIPNSVQNIGTAEAPKYVENNVPISGFSNNLNQYYNQTYNAGMGAAYVLVDKTFFKLREVSLSYTLPTKLISKTFIKSVEVALVGNNMFLWTPNSNLYTDPEMTTFGNDLSADFGDYGGTPSTRSIGFNLKLVF